MIYDLLRLRLLQRSEVDEISDFSVYNLQLRTQLYRHTVRIETD